MPIAPDDKDWTWVLSKPCPDCEFDAGEVDREDLGRLLRENAARWYPVLEGHDVAVRPAGNVWSPLEYACHVRDVNWLFEERVTKMLTEDDPQFLNWDQDATAVEDDYGSQDPEEVGAALGASAEAAASAYDSVSGDQWERPGRRSNGTVFTVETLGLYHLHDVVHHLWDVRG